MPDHDGSLIPRPIVRYRRVRPRDPSTRWLCPGPLGGPLALDGPSLGIPAFCRYFFDSFGTLAPVAPWNAKVSLKSDRLNCQNWLSGGSNRQGLLRDKIGRRRDARTWGKGQASLVQYVSFLSISPSGAQGQQLSDILFNLLVSRCMYGDLGRGIQPVHG